MLRKDEITWRCHICGRERPDSRISVRRKEHDGLTENIRYCNDDPYCVEMSKSFSLLSTFSSISEEEKIKKGFREVNFR